MSAQVVISQLPTGLPLTGIEVLPLVQNGITIQASTQAIADLSFGGAVVSRFNTRAGVVSLLATDVTDALGYTPGSVTAVSGTGTVSGLTLSGSVTTTGSLTLEGTLVITPADFGSQPGNTVLAAPNGATGTPTFRALLAADIPTLNQNTIGTSANVTGIVAVVNGGTGTSTPGLVAGTNISVTGAWPNQTINSTASSGTVTNIATGSGLSGGPITTTGTINLATAYGDTVNPYAAKNLSFVLAAPSGSSGLPTFRALVASDIPTLNQNTTGTAANVSGVVAILNGGTNATTQQGAINSIAGSVTSGQYLRGNGTNVTMSAIQAADVPTLNQNTTGTAANVTGIVAVANGGNGTATPSLVGGTNVTISGSWPNQTINSSGGGGGGVSSVTGTAPVVSSGGTTPAISLAASYGDTQNPYASKTTNNFLAAPNGSAGAPTFRAVVAADIPTLNQNTTGTAANVTGIVAVANGGSGTSTPSLVGGTNVTVSGSWPNQTINSSGGGGGSSTITISNKTSAYTVVAGDLATVINCTSGTFTVSLTAAATLGAGFNVTIWNTGTGVITIDPNGAETLDGVSTIVLRQGEGAQVVCDGTNWQTGNKKTMRGYAENIGSTEIRPVVSGSNSIAIGLENTASGNFSLAIGYLASATNLNSYAIGPGTSATSFRAVAFGSNSGGGGSQAVTGAGAMALGGSYASGADSFAAAVANNTSAYGATQTRSISFGQLSRANGIQSVAIGDAARAMSTNTIALGSNANATGSGSVVIAGGGTGWGATTTVSSAFALGDGAASNIYGKFAFASGSSNVGAGIFQSGLFILSITTTGATPTTLNSYNYGTSDSTNQVILPNNSAFAFTGTVVARQQAAGGTASAAWKVEGLIRREANAGTTTLVASVVTPISNIPLWALALTADTTNGGLAITATGAAATNIRWVATIQTSEVIYA